MSDSNDLLIRLAALEKENAALRGQQAPAASEPPAERPSKLDALLGKLIEQVEGLAGQADDLALPNDPSVDPIAQTAGRTQALCKTVVGLTRVIVSLIKATGTGFGASGAMLAAIGQEVESMKAGQALPARQVETIEVDDTGAPPPAPANGKSKPKPVAATPVGSPVGPPAAAPVGMPAEVAQLPQGTPAPIASVTVKS